MFVILVQTRTNAVGCQCATMRLKLRGDFLHRSFHIKGLRERLPTWRCLKRDFLAASTVRT